MKHALSLIVMIGTMAAALSAWADARHFTYSYEADSVLPKGKWEFEQWLTLRTVKNTQNFYRFDFREEIETGLTDRLTTALYLNFRDVHDDGADAFEFKGVSSEWKYMVLSPHTKWLGLLLYGEAKYEGEEVEWEEKIILEHIFGEKWILAMNLIAEHVWEFEDDEVLTELELEQTLGLAYKLSPHWSLGLEARVHSEWAHYNEYEHSVLFVGPNIHYEGTKAWVTFTLLPQILDLKNGGRNLDEHEAIEARVIAGVLF
ncbi:MAG: hypothetical protein HYU99_09130 [Deltaproteobacteria bacterium]|nr:hypothetical protein [Deltaproteobacteria bacterium]